MSFHTIESYSIKLQLLYSRTSTSRVSVFKKNYCFEKKKINVLRVGFWDVAIGEISTIQKKSGNELETKIKHHLQLLVDRQNVFMDNCHRLQSNERQIEDDMVFILGRILEHVDNK